MNSKILIRSLALFVFLVLLGVVLKATDLGGIFDEAWIDTDVPDRVTITSCSRSTTRSATTKFA